MAYKRIVDCLYHVDFHITRHFILKKPEYNIPALNLLSFLNCLFEIELLLELFNTTAAVDKFLLASKERMAC